MEVTLQGRGREGMGRDGGREEEEGYGVGTMSVSVSDILLSPPEHSFRLVCFSMVRQEMVQISMVFMKCASLLLTPFTHHLKCQSKYPNGGGGCTGYQDR